MLYLRVACHSNSVMVYRITESIKEIYVVTRKVFAGNPRESTVQRHRQTIKCPREAPEPNPRPGAHKTSISEHSICNLVYPSGPDLARRTKEKSAPGRPLIVNTGRDDWIRTKVSLLPKQKASVRLRLPSVCGYVPDVIQRSH